MSLPLWPPAAARSPRSWVPSLNVLPPPQRMLRRDFGNRKDEWEPDSKKPRKQDNFVQRGEFKNELFEEYYRGQGIVPEGEFDAFLAALRKPLPITFRINGSGKFANELRDKLQSDFFANFASMEVGGAAPGWS